jgi:hypothetical protein
VRSARKKGYNNGASGAAALLANGMGNTVTASGPRPQLRSSRNSAHFRAARERNQIKVSFHPPDGCAQFVRWFARKLSLHKLANSPRNVDRVARQCAH